MDGSSYTDKTIWGQNQPRPPLNPNTPTSASAYRTNVNRAKTRKWVEAKPQSYDGDDWGDDYDEPEQAPPLPHTGGFPQPTVPSPSVPGVATRTGSTSQPPASKPTFESAPPLVPAPANRTLTGAMRPSGGPPALQIQTQQPFKVVPSPGHHQAPTPVYSASGNYAQTASAQSSAAAPRSGPSSVYSQSEPGYTPVSLSHPSPVATHSGPGQNKFHPRQTSTRRHEKLADAYRRIGEEFERKRLADSPQYSVHSPAVTQLNDRESPAGAPEQHLAPSALNQEVAGSSRHSPVAHAPPPRHVETAETFGGDPSDGSKSPQLPNLARLSTFSVEKIFSNYGQHVAKSPRVPAVPENPVCPVSPESPQISVPEPGFPQQEDTGQQGPSNADSADGAAKVASQKEELGERRSKTRTPVQVSSDSTGVSQKGSSDIANDESKLNPVQAPGIETQKGPETTPLCSGPVASAAPTAHLGDVSPVSETDGEEEAGQEAVGGPRPGKEPDKHALLQSLPQLQTASPSATAQEAKPSPPTGTTDITPIAPLNPHGAGNIPESFSQPAIPQGEGTLSTIASSSSAKESDRLREEIMLTLSPVGPQQGNANLAMRGDVEPGSQLKVPSETGHDESSAQATKATPAAEPGTHISDRESGLVGEPSRRRFSWEDEPKAVNAGGDVDNDDKNTTVLANAEQISPGQSAPAIHEPKATSQPEIAQLATLSSNEANISHQVSQLSKAPRDGLGVRHVDSPSPLSILTNRGGEEPSGLELPGQASSSTMLPPKVSEQSGSPDSKAPQAAPVAAVAVPSPTAAKLMTFREIFSIPLSSERRKKYDETRAQFMAMESGLSHFLSALKASHPDLTSCSSVFPAPGPRRAAPGGQPTAAMLGDGEASRLRAHHHQHGQPPLQQPYCQQYTAPDNPTEQQAPMATDPPNQPPVPGQIHQVHSDFRYTGSHHLSNKGKELWNRTGKVGKDLLYKGRNKLRGTGDKIEDQTAPSQGKGAHPPLTHLNKKAGKRRSWGLINLGGRTSRGDGPSPDPSLQPSIQPEQSVASRPPAPSPAPQLPEPSRISPFSSVSQGGHSPVAPSGPASTSNNPDTVSASSLGPLAGQPWKRPHFMGPGASNQAELVSPLSETHPSPLIGQVDVSHVRKLESRQALDVTCGNTKTSDLVGNVPTHQRGPSAGHMVTEANPHGWAFLSPQDAPEKAKGTNQGPEAGNPMQENSHVPGRHPSFVGLPPIRRTSTFGLFSGKKDNAVDSSGESTSPPGAPSSSPASTHPSAVPGHDAAENYAAAQDYPTPAVTHVDSFPSTVAEHGSMGLPTLLRSSEEPHTRKLSLIQQELVRAPGLAAPLQRGSGQPTTVTRQHHIATRSQPVPPVVMPQQSTVLSQTETPAWLPQPPPGWQVEESHLSEPLLPTFRQRAPSNASDSDGRDDYSIEKEAEASLSRNLASRDSGPASGRMQHDHGSKASVQPSGGEAAASVNAGDGQSDIGSDMINHDSRRRLHPSLLPLERKAGTSSPPPSGHDAPLGSRENTSARSPSSSEEPSSQYQFPEKGKIGGFSSYVHKKLPKREDSLLPTVNSNGTEEGHAPKQRRFSGLKILKKTGSSHEHDRDHPISTHTARAPVQSHQSPVTRAQNHPTSGSTTFGRDRSNTTPELSFGTVRNGSLRPAESTEGHGRRVSGPNFMSKLWNRSSSKNRDAKPQQSPPTAQIYAAPSPHGPSGPHHQPPRMMPPGPRGPIAKGNASMYPGPGLHGQTLLSEQATMVGSGGPRGQHFQADPGQSRPAIPSHQSTPYLGGRIPQQSPQQGMADTRQTPAGIRGQISQPYQQPHGIDAKPFPETRTAASPMAPPSPPSPASQRSQPLVQPPHGAHSKGTASNAAAGSPRPGDSTSDAIDKPTLSPFSSTSVQPSTAQGLVDGLSSCERRSGSSSHGSPAFQGPRPVNNGLPQTGGTTRVSKTQPSQQTCTQSTHVDSPGHADLRASPPRDDAPRTSAPSLVQSPPPPLSSQQAQSQGPKFSGQAPGAYLAVGQNTTAERHSSANFDVYGVPMEHRMVSPHQVQSRAGSSTTNTQGASMSSALGTPRSPYLLQQQFLASNVSASSHDAQGKPMLHNLQPGGSLEGIPFSHHTGPQSQARPGLSLQTNAPPPGHMGSARSLSAASQISAQRLPKTGQQPLPYSQPQMRPQGPVLGFIQPGPPQKTRQPHLYQDQTGPEPQYDPVPIPQAYRPVHGNGIPTITQNTMMGGYFIRPPSWARGMVSAQPLMTHSGTQRQTSIGTGAPIGLSCTNQPASKNMPDAQRKTSPEGHESLARNHTPTLVESGDGPPREETSHLRNASTVSAASQGPSQNQAANTVDRGNAPTVNNEHQEKPQTEPAALVPVTERAGSISSKPAPPKPQAPGRQSLSQSSRPECQSQVSDEAKSETQPNAATTNTNARSTAPPVTVAGPSDITAAATETAAKKPATTTANTGDGLVEEKQVVFSMREQEEKIPVLTDQDRKQGHQLDEDVPMMSATSYPGQEWNPYGNLEDYND